MSETITPIVVESATNQEEKGHYVVQKLNGDHVAKCTSLRKAEAAAKKFTIEYEEWTNIFKLVVSCSPHKRVSAHLTRK